MSKVYVPTFNKVQIEIIEESSVGSLIYDNQQFAIAKIIKVGEAAGSRAGHKLQTFSEGQRVIVRKGAVASINTKNEALSVVDDDQIVTIILEDAE